MIETAVSSERRFFWIAAAIAIVMSLTGISLYVDQLLVTFLHEASHGLAAILTGGHLVQFTISPNTSGLALTSGGFRPLILLAGYMGSCIWGGAMLVAARKRGWARAVLFGLGVFMAVFTVLFVRNLFGLVVGGGYAAFFIWAARRGQGWHLSLLLSFLAVRNSLNALGDLRVLWRLSGYGGPMTDAQLMSYELTAGLVPPAVFAFGIGLISVVVLALFVRLAFRPDAIRPLEPASRL